MTYKQGQRVYVTLNYGTMHREAEIVPAEFKGYTKSGRIRVQLFDENRTRCYGADRISKYNF